MNPNELYLCVHGHFYQPPRENPWLELIEQQESAFPFHDWNERIHYECYRVNAMSRIYDHKGKIVNIVSNYTKMSFNFGPTLLSWMQTKKPETYQLILEADKVSLNQNRGHGNALAQVYNHMIMPLANRQDKVTQVFWGIEDFKYRFGRNPESIWLAETACNEETLEVLVQFGVKFIILSPFQAEAVRDLNSEQWQDVSHSSINPKEPYRCFLKNNPEKFIDIFFYDGPISQAISFDHILRESKIFMDRLETAFDPDMASPQLIHVATDGETYGHHKAFGDRVLAYLLQEEAPKRGYQITNYSLFLEKFPPTKAVCLKEGENGEGTAWSCAHGVRRWRDNCGCHTGGLSEWNQLWRKPLREALDWLRDQLIVLFETEGEKYFHDVWEARNQYIHVILNRNSGSIKKFFQKQAKRELNEKETSYCLQLLEIARHSMLMYTSCGWFFSELTGIETLQILQYAARAIQLAERTNPILLEKEFLKQLGEAKSNIPACGTGKDIYLKEVKPHIVYLSNVAGYYAIFSILKDFTEEEKKSFFCFHLEVLDQRKESLETITLNYGRIKISSKITLSKDDFIFVSVQHGPYDFRCYVKRFIDQNNYEEIEKELFEFFYTTHVVDLLKTIEKHFKENKMDLKDLPLEWRTQIVNNASKETIEKIHKTYEELYEENRNLPSIYSSVNVPIPEELKYISEITLGNRTEKLIRELAEKNFPGNKMKRLETFHSIAQTLGIQLNKNNLKEFLCSQLNQKAKRLFESPNEQTLKEIESILEIAEGIKITVDKALAQDYLFLLLKKWRLKEEYRVPEELKKKTFKLAEELGLNTELFKEPSRK